MWGDLLSPGEQKSRQASLGAWQARSPLQQGQTHSSVGLLYPFQSPFLLFLFSLPVCPVLILFFPLFYLCYCLTSSTAEEASSAGNFWREEDAGRLLREKRSPARIMASENRLSSSSESLASFPQPAVVLGGVQTCFRYAFRQSPHTQGPSHFPEHLHGLSPPGTAGRALASHHR